MDTMRIVAAWVMFLVMAITAAVFWRQSTLRGERMEVLEATISDMHARIRLLAEEVGSLQAQLETVATAVPEGEPSKNEGSDGSVAMSMAPEAPDSPFFERILSALSDDPAEAGLPTDLFQNLTELFQGESGKAFLNETLRGTMEMHYGPFLDTLPSETAEAFMEAMVEQSMQMAQHGMQMFGQNQQDGDVARRMENSAREMEERLRLILGEEGYDAYVEYSSEAAANAYKEHVDMQLRMFGANLDPDVRELISATLAEEMMGNPMHNQFSQMEVSFDDQADALDRAMERLSPLLDEDAYRVLERFADYQRRMYDLMDSLMPRPKEQ